MDYDNQGIERTKKIIEEAAKQYVNETKMEFPSIANSDLTITSNHTEVVILRDNKGNIIAHYQLLKEYSFLRLDDRTA